VQPTKVRKIGKRAPTCGIPFEIEDDLTTFDDCFLNSVHKIFIRTMTELSAEKLAVVVEEVLDYMIVNGIVIRRTTGELKVNQINLLFFCFVIDRNCFHHHTASTGRIAAKRRSPKRI
jgi:hypothetical protein